MDLDPSSSELVPRKTSSTRQQFGWLSQIIFQPGQTFKYIVAESKKKTWLVPITVVSLLIIVAALISTFLTTPTTSTSNLTGAAVATRAAQSAQTTRTVTTNRGTTQNQGNQFPGGMPGGDIGGFIPPDMGGGGFGRQITGGNTTTTGTTTSSTTSSTNIWLTLLWPVLSFLITWLLLGGLTNVFSLAFGGHSQALIALNIAAWSSVPIGIRNLAQIVYYLASGATIQSPGLSGFLTSAGNNTLLVFAQFLLARVDIYLFWQIALLAIGVGIWGGLTRGKAATIAVIAVILVVLLQSLVGLGVNLLGNVNFNTSMLLRLR